MDEYAEIGMPEDTAAMLLIEVDGFPESVDRELRQIEEICKKNDAMDVSVAGNRREAKRLWRARRAISPSLSRLNPHKLNEDVVVPRSRIVDLIAGVRDIAGRHDVKIASFGHAGDGNIHVNIMIDRDVEGELERGEKAVKDLFRLTIDLGGTISGEHGVGTTKAPYIGMELGREEIGLMKRLKELFDPKGILNPGKIFVDEGM